MFDAFIGKKIFKDFIITGFPVLYKDGITKAANGEMKTVTRWQGGLKKVTRRSDG